MGSHISKIDGVYVCSFTAAETKNRRELQLAPSKVPETGLGERAAQKVDLLRTAVPAVEQEPPAADIEMAVPQAVEDAAGKAHEPVRQRFRRLAVKVTLALVDDCVPVFIMVMKPALCGGRRAGAKGIYRHRAARRRRIGGSRCKSSRWSIGPSVSGVPRAHRSDWGRRQLAYIVADAHLLAPKLRTLSPHDTTAAARRNDGWNALERVRLLDLARRA